MISLGAVCHDPVENKLLGEAFQNNIQELPGFPRDHDTMKFFWQEPENREAWDFCQIQQESLWDAMTHFATWLVQLKAKYEAEKLLFVAQPVAFDWGFVNYYLWNYAGRNPFHYSPVCLTNYARGILQDTEFGSLSRSSGTWPDEFDVPSRRPHFAFEDALAQAKSCKGMIEYVRSRRSSN